MSKKRKALTQEEIWDDSELIDSWNEAVEEYKYYHSLHARGEKVEDVLRQTEDAESKSGNAATVSAEELNGDDMADLEGEVLESGELASHEDNLHKKNADEIFDTPKPTHDVQQTIAPGLPSAGVPQILAAGVQDEALKNLMMSWYYAGYYTGLYEGRNQAQSQAKADDKPQEAVQNRDSKE